MLVISDDGLFVQRYFVIEEAGGVGVLSAYLFGDVNQYHQALDIFPAVAVLYVAEIVDASVVAFQRSVFLEVAHKGAPEQEGLVVGRACAKGGGKGRQKYESESHINFFLVG